MPMEGIERFGVGYAGDPKREVLTLSDVAHVPTSNGHQFSPRMNTNRGINIHRDLCEVKV